MVEQNFADQVKPDKAIYKGAIPGMLRTLDPHSNFFDPKDYQGPARRPARPLLRRRHDGRPRNGKTIVLAPFAGSPAYKAGLRPGDVILEVNDKKTDDLTTTEVADLLKGRAAPRSRLKVGARRQRPAVTFNIIRDEIPRSSVPDAFLIRSPASPTSRSTSSTRTPARKWKTS